MLTNDELANRQPTIKFPSGCTNDLVGQWPKQSTKLPVIMRLAPTAMHDQTHILMRYQQAGEKVDMGKQSKTLQLLQRRPDVVDFCIRLGGMQHTINVDKEIAVGHLKVAHVRLSTPEPSLARLTGDPAVSPRHQRAYRRANLWRAASILRCDAVRSIVILEGRLGALALEVCRVQRRLEQGVLHALDDSKRAHEPVCFIPKHHCRPFAVGDWMTVLVVDLVD